jgi:hypothetical protein
MRIAALHSWYVAFVLPFIVLAANNILDTRTHPHAGDYVSLAYFVLYGVYCVQNFAHCREIHCVFTGPGFLLAALLMLLRVGGLFDHGFGPPYIVLLVAAAAGCVAEARYVRRTGTKFSARHT